MLKKHKNEFFEELENFSLDSENFVWVDTNDPTSNKWIASTIQLDETPMRFSIMKEHDEAGYRVQFTTFDNGFPYSSSEGLDIDDTKSLFYDWLRDEVESFIEEELKAPDYWEQNAIARNNLNIEEIDFDDPSEFTSEEKRLLKQGLSEIPDHIKSTEQFSENELKVIENKIDYLIEAVDRLNKTDWKSVAISVIVSISTALSLDTERGQILYNLFKKILSSVPQIPF